MGELNFEKRNEFLFGAFGMAATCGP